MMSVPWTISCSTRLRRVCPVSAIVKFQQVKENTSTKMIWNGWPQSSILPKSEVRRKDFTRVQVGRMQKGLQIISFSLRRPSSCYERNAVYCANSSFINRWLVTHHYPPLPKVTGSFSPVTCQRTWSSSQGKWEGGSNCVFVYNRLNWGTREVILNPALTPMLDGIFSWDQSC